MKPPRIWIVVVVAFLLGVGLGWFAAKGSPPRIDDNPLVIRLRAERDSLAKLATAYDQRAARWMDSVANLDREIARVSSRNTQLAAKVGQYEREIGVFRGTPDDLHRELNWLIRSRGATSGTDSASAVHR